MWNFVINFHPRMLISNSKAWWSPCLKSTVCEGECSPSTMIYLSINQTVVLMDCFVDSFPPFCLSLRIQIASTWKSVASLTPGGRLGQQKSCFRSLGVVLDQMVVGNSGLDVAPDSGQSWKNDSIFKEIFSEINLVAPVFEEILSLRFGRIHKFDLILFGFRKGVYKGNQKIIKFKVFYFHLICLINLIFRKDKFYRVSKSNKTWIDSITMKMTFEK